MGLKITEYRMHKQTPALELALVTDLHERDPAATIETLQTMKPDLILVAGDLMERHEPGESHWNIAAMDAWQGIARRRTRLTRLIKRLDGSLFSQSSPNVQYHKENSERFLREASKLAPIVLSMGNHEWYYRMEDELLFKELGIYRLDNEDIVLNVKGRSVRIGGFSTRYDLQWIRRFSAKRGEKILLCHHPDYYVKYIQNTEFDTFDLVLSGHTHGGQWRLHSHGGIDRGIPVFAPGQGIFPDYAYGRYGKLIVSSGVANTTSIPRFGNPCEIVRIIY